MVKQVRELWRMVRAGGQLAITTWGPRMFEPGSAAWWAAVKQFRPDLHAAFNPWERIITPQAVRQLLNTERNQNAETSSQRTVSRPSNLRRTGWTVARGSGYRWTLEQMDRETAARVREVNLTTLRESGIKFIETNANDLCSGDENIGACFFGTPRRSQVTVNVRSGR